MSKKSRGAAAGRASSKPRKAVAGQPLRLEWVQARTLRGNPANWRVHPPGQRRALQALLGDREVGWAGALLYNERTRRLVDGHLRLSSVKPDDFVPVLVGRWSEPAERKILLTLDPLAGMAQADAGALQALLAEVGPLSDDLAGLQTALDALSGGNAAATGGGEKGEKATAARLTGLLYRVEVDCADEREQARLLERFTKEGLTCRALIS